MEDFEISPDLSAMHRTELEAHIVHQARLIARLGETVGEIAISLDDEGDRVYLGSTNDADTLRKLSDSLDHAVNILECRHMHGRDLYAELKALRTEKFEMANLLNDAEPVIGQIENDFRHPPAKDSIERRVERANKWLEAMQERRADKGEGM